MQAYEDEVRSKGTGVNRSLHKLFDTLAGRGATAYAGTYVRVDVDEYAKPLHKGYCWGSQ